MDGTLGHSSARLRPAAKRRPSLFQLSTFNFQLSPAFTLLEILLVLGLLVVMAGLTWPLYSNVLRGEELPKSGDNLRGLLAMVRAEGIMQNARARVRFEPGEQQPIIEFEKDPIREPGVFEAVDSSNWIQGPVLMGDVQVYRVTPGRPIYTKPISTKKDADEEAENDEEEIEIREEHEEGGEGMESSVSTGEEDVDVDEYRPAILFEVDGSTDWATLIVARTQPKDELQEQDAQVWIELDGRTGLAKIRPKVTEMQLADAEFYVEREKLEPPDRYDVGADAFALGSELTDIPGGGGGSPLESLLDGAAVGSGGGSGVGTMLGGAGADGAGSDEQAAMDAIKNAAGEAGLGPDGMGDGSGFGRGSGQMGDEGGNMPGTRSGIGSQRGGGAGRLAGGRFGDRNGGNGGPQFGRPGDGNGQEGGQSPDGMDPDAPPQDDPSKDSSDTANLSPHDQQVLQELDTMLASDPDLTPQEREQIHRDFLEAIRNSGGAGGEEDQQ